MYLLAGKLWKIKGEKLLDYKELQSQAIEQVRSICDVRLLKIIIQFIKGLK